MLPTGSLAALQTISQQHPHPPDEKDTKKDIADGNVDA